MGTFGLEAYKEYYFNKKCCFEIIFIVKIFLFFYYVPIKN